MNCSKINGLERELQSVQPQCHGLQGARSSQQLTTYRGGLSRKKSEKNRYGTSNGPEGQSQTDVCRSHPTHAETNNETDMA